MFRDAMEGARKIYAERYGAVMVDGRLTTAGVSSSRDADPLPEPGEGVAVRKKTRPPARSVGTRAPIQTIAEILRFLTSTRIVTFEVSELQ